MNNPITQSTDETCNIVQDLLPLYYDDVCSPSSKRLVEKHLKTCEKCQNTYNELKNDSIDSMIKKEADSVLKQHEKKEKTAAYKTGVIIAGLLLIPILITFIVCLSNGGWFKYLCGGNSIYASCGCNDSCSTYGTAEKTYQMHNLRCFCSAFDILF